MNKLFSGRADFVGRRRLWYMISAAVLIVAILGILVRGFTLGIDFQGGTKMTMPAGDLDAKVVAQTFEEATGVSAQEAQVVGSGDARTLEISSERLSDDQIAAARSAIFDAYHPEDSAGNSSPDVIGDSTVSESWGSTITNRMLISLVVFLVIIFGYITIRFERDMAISAIVALLVDAVVVAGIYAIVGFEVTPATVTGLLTVLAFSLYDTVVVFDKVKENTKGLFRQHKYTYAEASNIAVNQTLMRSISTTIIAVLPILSLMIVAVWMMGVGTLKDLALVQLIGVIEGTFSSIFLATPILVSLKRRQRKIKKHDEAVLAARGAEDPDAAFREAMADELAEELAKEEAKDAQKTIVEEEPRMSRSWRP
ncbi:MAG: protein translocase subunit SecF [Corynebacterium sp.]|nr:protein translocase subunit SecF [Corynebacterium sp.]